MAEHAETPGPPEPAAAPAVAADDAGRLTGASRKRLVAVLIALVLLAEILPLQSFMIAVVVPKIGLSFPGIGANVTWSLTILGVAGGATMALAGKLGDLWGKKRVLLLASVLFIAGTLLCALTHNWALFLLGRGISATSWGMSAIEYGLIRDLMPRRWIPICVGVLGTGFGLSTVIGPLVVGALTDHYSWRSIFWFLTVYTVLVAPLVAAVVPESPLRVRQRFDVVGAVVFGVSVAAVLIYLSEGSTWGWTTTGSLAYLIGGVLGLVVFVLWERRVTDPMIELSLLRAPKVSLLMGIALLATAVLQMGGLATAYMFETPRAAVLKQQILAAAAAKGHVTVPVLSHFVHWNGDLGYAAGFSVLQLAVHITMWTAVFGLVFGPLGGWLARKVNARLPLLIGTAGLAAACALWVPWHSTWQQQLSIGVLFGLGFGFYYAATPNLLMDAVPAERQGISAGMLAVFGGIGTSVAAAAFTAVLAAHPFQMVVTPPGGKPIVTDIPQVYSNSGYSMIYLVIGVVPAALALLFALALRSGRAPAAGGAAGDAAIAGAGVGVARAEPEAEAV